MAGSGWVGKNVYDSPLGLLIRLERYRATVLGCVPLASITMLLKQF
ncbi:MAG: hypothetical protein H8K05_07460 [Nitrospira sp.]|nr:hypothetical protein [Nitrospira sp.]